jgi:hypothetical protein
MDGHLSRRADAHVKAARNLRQDACHDEAVCAEREHAHGQD